LEVKNFFVRKNFCGQFLRTTLADFFGLTVSGI